MIDIHIAKINPANLDMVVFSSRGMIRSSIIESISGSDDINSISGATNNIELITNLYTLNSPVVIIHSPESKKFFDQETVRLVNDWGNNAKPLVILDEYVRETELRALGLGIHGCLPESRVRTDLIRAIIAISSGELRVRGDIMVMYLQQILLRALIYEYKCVKVPLGTTWNSFRIYRRLQSAEVFRYSALYQNLMHFYF